MRHLIAILLQNEAGALTRVTGLISTRGYNIESLSVAPTNDPTVSRVTLVTIGSDQVIAQINAQLLKLVDVVAVEDMTSGDHLARELLLIKLQIAAEHVEDVIAAAGVHAAVERTNLRVRGEQSGHACQIAVVHYQTVAGNQVADLDAVLEPLDALLEPCRGLRCRHGIHPCLLRRKS